MDKVEKLLGKYNSGTATIEERATVESWYLQYKTPEGNLGHEQILEEYKLGLVALSNSVNKKPIRLWPKIAAAASILLCLAIGGYFLGHRLKDQQVVQNQPHDIGPGGNKAILTLANGQKIILNNKPNGQLVKQGNTAISKASDDLVVYDSPAKQGNANSELPLTYNVISTPKTGKIAILLPDGTKVYLDAVSSIKFPTAFTGNERKVEITGQVYFEVAHNKQKPFRVTTRGQIVEVLGTHFNINAYDDESMIKTTLLEGSIKLTDQGHTKLLKPGEQAQVANAGPVNINVISNVDRRDVVAWKDGYFMFNDGLESLMRKIARWYDVEVIYQKKPDPSLAYWGEVSRSRNLSDVLKIIEKAGSVRFRLEGRRLTVMP